MVDVDIEEKIVIRLSLEEAQDFYGDIVKGEDLSGVTFLIVKSLEEKLSDD